MFDSAERLPDEELSRLDETDDREFYASKRLVQHLDRRALDAVEQIIGSLLVDPQPAILDLMASWDSHLPQSLCPSRVVGLGLNDDELAENEALDERLIHDLNATPQLPFADQSFDAVINTVSVDYLTRPYEVFSEVARILRPGGLFLVLFSNRMFPPKAVKVWREASEEERLWLVEHYFAATPDLGQTSTYIVKGRSRPEEDRHYRRGLPSDPILAVWAERRGATRSRPRPRIGGLQEADEIAARRRAVHRTLRCPYCETRLSSWQVPDSPFCEWDGEMVYLCLDPDCPYTVRSWDVMEQQGNSGFGYRLMFHPERNRLYSVPDRGFGRLRAAKG